jgi:hypothetical protein
MGTKTGLNGITFGDATVQNTAAVTGVSSAVAGSGISVSGSTGAVTFTNSGVTSIVAGTGISISGGTGAVTVTASGGGVTSLNGQSGAITDTDYGAIGSYVVAATGGGTNYTESVNATVAGSTLTRWSGGDGSLNMPMGYDANAVVLNLSTYVGGSWTSLSLTGTWRRLTAGYQNTINSSNARLPNLYVRIS